MEREYPAQERMRERIQTLRSLIEHNPGETVDRVIAVLCLRFGVTTRTLREYVRVLLHAGIIEERDGRLYLTEISEDEKPSGPPMEREFPADSRALDDSAGVSPTIEAKEEEENTDAVESKGKKDRRS